MVRLWFWRDLGDEETTPLIEDDVFLRTVLLRNTTSSRRGRPETRSVGIERHVGISRILPCMPRHCGQQQKTNTVPLRERSTAGDGGAALCARTPRATEKLPKGVFFLHPTPHLSLVACGAENRPRLLEVDHRACLAVRVGDGNQDERRPSISAVSFASSKLSKHTYIIEYDGHYYPATHTTVAGALIDAAVKR